MWILLSFLSLLRVSEAVALKVGHLGMIREDPSQKYLKLMVVKSETDVYARGVEFFFARSRGERRSHFFHHFLHLSCRKCGLWLSLLALVDLVLVLVLGLLPDSLAGQADYCLYENRSDYDHSYGNASWSKTTKAIMSDIFTGHLMHCEDDSNSSCMARAMQFCVLDLVSNLRLTKFLHATLASHAG